MGQSAYPLPRIPSESPFQAYGTAHAHYEMMQRELTAAAQRVPFPENDRFEATGADIVVHFNMYSQPGPRARAMSLHNFYPYLATHSAMQLVALIGESSKGGGLGQKSFPFDPLEIGFLEHGALSYLVQQKLHSAPVGSIVTFGLKCFGMGGMGAECVQLLKMWLRELRNQPPSPELGAIRCIISGFDIDPVIAQTVHREIRRGIYDAARKHPLADRLLIASEIFYGDFSNPALLPTILSYGTHDIAVWRNTHVFMHADAQQVEPIVAAVRGGLSRPGIFLLHEAQSAANLLQHHELIVS